MTAGPVERAFLRTGHGLIHYRHAGDGATGTPLVLAHGGPGSSAGLAPLIAALAEGRRVVAPDMMGNGESDPPPGPETSIAFYAEGLLAVMDHLGLGTVDLYGHHTGAQVITEFALAHPGRVRRLVLDGVGLFPEAQRTEFLTRYAPPITPDPSGEHLAWLWGFIDQTTQHFPHYLRDDAHRIEGGGPLPPEVNTARCAEVLKVWSTYHLSYGAAFRHRFAERLPLLAHPTLVLEIARDPLAIYAKTAVGLIPGARLQAIAAPQRGETIRGFLDEALDQNVTNSAARAAMS
jgi:pimeloyl-ACP methyl ester carboxylesterase